jgi:hypothetical protein
VSLLPNAEAAVSGSQEAGGSASVALTDFLKPEIDFLHCGVGTRS